MVDFDITLLTVDVGCVDVNPNEEGTVHVVNADHGVWPDSGFCRVIFEQDIKAVGPYVLDIELLNTVRPGIVYWGHPGVIYNVVDEDNFDFVYFRLVTFEVYLLVQLRAPQRLMRPFLHV